jgi:hypothetical protein
MTEHLSKRVTDHDHHPRPEEPVTGAGNVSGLIHARKGQEGHHVSPSFIAWVSSLSLTNPIVDSKRPNNTPCEDRAKKIGDADVEAY